MTEYETVAFIGATGMIGKPTFNALRESGFKLRAITHGTQPRTLPGVEVAHGDVRDTESLIKAFEGARVVYVNLSTTPDQKNALFRLETDGLSNVIQAARRAGVPKIAYLSSLMQRTGGYDWWVLDVKRQAVEILKASGLEYLIFYPSNFMESLAYKNKRGSRLNLAGRARHKNWWIAGEDYGRQVARALALWKDGSREYVVQGPEALTYDEAAEIFVRNYTHEKLKLSRAPLGVLKLLGFFSAEIDYVARISEAIHVQPEKFESAETWRELGKPELTVAQFARTAIKPRG